jgi:hypothetical protein
VVLAHPASRLHISTYSSPFHTQEPIPRKCPRYYNAIKKSGEPDITLSMPQENIMHDDPDPVDFRKLYKESIHPPLPSPTPSRHVHHAHTHRNSNPHPQRHSQALPPPHIPSRKNTKKTNDKTLLLKESPTRASLTISSPRKENLAVSLLIMQDMEEESTRKHAQKGEHDGKEWFWKLAWC